MRVRIMRLKDGIETKMLSQNFDFVHLKNIALLSFKLNQFRINYSLPRCIASQVKGLINKEDSKPPPTSSPLVAISPVVQTTKQPKNSTVKPAYITPVTTHVHDNFYLTLFVFRTSLIKVSIS